MRIAYLDASAMVKLAVDEPESRALRLAVEGAELWTSLVGRVEFERAVRRAVEVPEPIIDGVLETVDVIAVHPPIAKAAARVEPAVLRTLDAIHLATMRAMQDDLSVAFIYDARLASAASAVGIEVQAPR